MKKETFGERIKRARGAKGFTQVQLAEKLGVKQQIYQPWEAGKDGKQIEPNYDMLVKISKVLDVSVEWLLEGFFKNIESVSRPLGGVPLISWVRAGKMHYPIDNLQPGESEGPPVPSTCKDQDCFALRVQGDSMMPEFQEGEIIVVSPNTEAHSGDYVVAKYDGEVAFKKLKIYPDAVILRPLNEKFEEIVIKGKMLKNFKVVGKVVEKIKRY